MMDGSTSYVQAYLSEPTHTQAWDKSESGNIEMRVRNVPAR